MAVSLCRFVNAHISCNVLYFCSMSKFCNTYVHQKRIKTQKAQTRRQRKTNEKREAERNNKCCRSRTSDQNGYIGTEGERKVIYAIQEKEEDHVCGARHHGHCVKRKSI